jgi:hypothetical protein
MNILVSGKQNLKKRKIKAANAVQKTEVEDVLEKNKNFFDHFTAKIQIDGVDGYGEFDNIDDGVKVGALTNFDELVKKDDDEDEDEDKNKELEETEGLTVEELEQRKLETFRAQKKKEMEALTAEMNELKEKVANIKKKALETQEILEQKNKELEEAQQRNIELRKDVKTKDAVLECKWRFKS